MGKIKQNLYDIIKNFLVLFCRINNYSYENPKICLNTNETRIDHLCVCPLMKAKSLPLQTTATAIVRKTTQTLPQQDPLNEKSNETTKHASPTLSLLSSFLIGYTLGIFSALAWCVILARGSKVMHKNKNSSHFLYNIILMFFI